MAESMIGWRHLHTRARTGALGSPGFQTVGAARELAGRRREALDDLVSRALPRDRSDHHPRLLVQPSPTDLGLCVLTRIEPREDSFDGAPGNRWAESFVVPQPWLARSGWNLAAAVAALDWWGPQRGVEEIENRGGAPAELPEEPLPELAPAPASPDRQTLERLAELAPDREVRAALLAAFARQADDDRQPSEPVYVVAASDDGLRELEELLLRLPLAFPPALRARADDDGRLRCLRLAVPAEPGALPAPDLVGLREARLDDVRGRAGVLVDLGGAVPPPEIGGTARDRARQVEAALAGEDHPPDRPDPAAPEPSASDPADAEPADAPAPAPDPPAEGAPAPSPSHQTQPRRASSMPPKDPSRDHPAASRPADAPGSGDALAARRTLWSEREEAEGEAGSTLDLLRLERKERTERMEELVQRQLEQYRKEVDRLRDSLRHTGGSGMRDLQVKAEELRDELDTVIQGGLEDLQRVGRNNQDTYTKQRDRILEDLQVRHEDALRQIDERRKRAVQAIQMREQQARKPTSGRRAAGVPVDEPWPEEDLQDEGFRDEGFRDEERPEDERKAASGRDGERRTGARVATLWERVRAGFGTRWSWIALVAAVVLVAAGATAWVLLSGPGESADSGGGVDNGASPGEAEPDADATGELESRVLQALARPDVATTLLRTALEPDPRGPLANRAAQAWVLATRGPDRPLTETTSCALLQKVISDWQTDRGRNAIGIDGQCGDGTRQALAPVAAAFGCEGDPWTERAACVLNRRVAPERADDCPASWPFQRSCRWQVGEAQAFLGLLRQTRRVAAAVEADRYDLLENPALADELPELTADAARDLLPLAHLVERAADDALPPGAPWRTGLDREELERILDWLPPQGATPAEEGAGTEETPAP